MFSTKVSRDALERCFRERGIVNIKKHKLKHYSCNKVLKIPFSRTIKKEENTPLFRTTLLNNYKLTKHNINYNTIYTPGSLYNGLFVKRIIKRPTCSFNASLQLSQLRHLRHTYFSHSVSMSIVPLHLRSVMFSQNPDVSQALLLRVLVDGHALRHNGHLLQTGRQTTQML